MLAAVFFEEEVDEGEVVTGMPPPRPPSADSIEVVVLLEVDVVVVARLVLVVTCDCGRGGVLVLVVFKVVEVVKVVEEDLNPSPPVTPAPPVGSVTETSAGGATAELAIVTEIVVLPFPAADVVVFANDGHKAATIPPFLTIPSNVFELTCTFEQELDTLLAIEFSADTHCEVQPLLKSDVVQVGIWLSYVN